MIRDIKIPEKEKFKTRQEKFLDENRGKVIILTDQWTSMSDWCYTFYERKYIGLDPKEALQHLMRYLGLRFFATKSSFGEWFDIQVITNEEFEKKWKETDREVVVRNPDAEINKLKILKEFMDGG